MSPSGDRPRPQEDPTHPITFLWSVPRSVSTSFERMVSERGDHEVFDEPYSRHYYYGPRRCSQRYSETIPHSSPEELLAMIRRAAEQRPVFVKDMAYQAAVLLDDPAQVGRFRNCFMVREPAAALRSLAHHWPDFTDEETGWEQLDRAADVVLGTGQPLVVVDAERLCTDPAGTVAAWCEAMGLDYREDALTWAPGMLEQWKLWGDWHENTSTYTGFGELRESDPPAPDEGRVYDAYAPARRVYDRLSAHAL